ncbi:MAG TPA: hypothetical protein VFX05_15095 [Casimicrobiaceae bacterium]|nr:hypothetical protein [Casimicrobiaceae bacterium]
MPRLVAFLVAVAGACGFGPSAAAAADRLAPVPAGTLADDFLAAWTDLERTPREHAEPGLRRVALAAGHVLAARGVLWHTPDDDAEVRVITPVRTGVPLNEFAWRVHRELAGLGVVFDPRKLNDEQAGALYDETAHRLVVSVEEVAAGRVSDYVEHELVHARNVVALARGVDLLFTGWVRRRPLGAELHPAYPDRFSLDELPAYAMQAAANLRELGGEDGHGDLAGTAEMIDVGEDLARVAAAVAARAAGALASMAQSPWSRFREERLVDDEAVVVVGLRGREGVLHFRPGTWPAWAADAPPLTHAVVEAGDADLEFVVPRMFTRPVGAKALQVYRLRALEIAACAERIAATFASLRARLEDGDLDGAVALGGSLRALTDRRHVARASSLVAGAGRPPRG